MGAVLDQHEAMFPAYLRQPVQLHRLPGVVHRHDRLRSLSDRCLHLLRIDIIRLRINIGKDRSAAAVKSAVR